MEKNNVAPEVIEKILQSITSFALYGFPESHAISFAILAYGSAYLKVHRAPEFYASLLNNQPMGFYTPATIVKDAQRHGVKDAAGLRGAVGVALHGCLGRHDSARVLRREWVARGACAKQLVQKRATPRFIGR